MVATIGTGGFDKSVNRSRSPPAGVCGITPAGEVRIHFGESVRDNDALSPRTRSNCFLWTVNTTRQADSSRK
jgi:hypothetical protein